MLKKRKDIIKIIHVGVSGIPYVKTAAINRCLAIYSTLPRSQFDLLAINNRSLTTNDISAGILKKGEYFGLKFQFTTAYIKKPNSFLLRRVNNIYSRFNEFKLISKLGIHKKIDLIFFYPSGFFFELLYYRFFSKIFGFKLITHYVEYRSSFKSRSNIFKKLNDRLFDKYFMNFVDGVIPISEFLINRIKQNNKDLPILKIPPIVDFSLFKGNKNNIQCKYFLYVGSTGYLKSIEIILDSFELITDDSYFLYLMLSGNKESILKKIKKHNKKELIKVFSDLDYTDLINYYNNACALLIPLSESIQDRARFPQKISEYLASGNPIISTNFGEIRYYFKDMDNALIASDYKASSIADKMDFVIHNPDESIEIGRNGYKTGLKYFECKSYGSRFMKFVLDVLNK